MFVQISPSEHDVSETLSSLNFATRVRGVELGPARRQLDTGELQKMKALVWHLQVLFFLPGLCLSYSLFLRISLLKVEKARQESRSKDESIKKLEENIQNLEGKNKGRDHSYRSLQEKNKELQTQLDLLNSQSEKQNAQLQERFKSRDDICSNLQQKVRSLSLLLLSISSVTILWLIMTVNITPLKVKELEYKLRERHQSDSA